MEYWAEAFELIKEPGRGITAVIRLGATLQRFDDRAASHFWVASITVAYSRVHSSSVIACR
jgi:hypothetical protein